VRRGAVALTSAFTQAPNAPIMLAPPVMPRTRKWLLAIPVMLALVGALSLARHLWRTYRLVNPTPAPTRFLDYQTKTELHLPFDGQWYVFWGGRTGIQNHHVACSDQRFAYDLVAYENGHDRAGNSKTNDDYYAFGRPILAPADAVVAEAVDGLPDNVPGVMDRKHPAGNHVVLDFGNGEYALMAHFKSGSVRVKAGDHVARGDVVAQCGNSGNTSQPHLHFHLQNTQTVAACSSKVEGLPAFFVDYVADGQPVARGEPVRGQTIWKP
jgi:hypothetical protein